MNTPFDIQQLWNLPTNEFMDLAKQLCVFQASNNPVYKQWIKLSNQSISELETLDAIPFLPISFFKNQDVYIGEKPSTLFESSGTTQDVVSKHWVADTNLYEASFLNCFQRFYGNPADYCIIGLLPSYLERQHSSLVYMVDKLIQASGHPQSGFYLNEFEKLKYATVIETGGMKGRKEELTKEALHALLKNNLGVNTIHSEYGMTELLSQAYSIGNGIFKCPPWMKVLVGEEQDPTALKSKGRGVLHIIDLANIYSCAFIATQDMGEVYADGSFQVLGRLDHSDRRGCSLLVI
jgi:hypothetical protein